MVENVLIETLWNVKEVVENDLFDTETGINRNIVECKGGMKLVKEVCLLRINRNIMECKDRLTDYQEEVKLQY